MKIKLLVLVITVCMIAIPARADLAVVVSSDSISFSVQSNTTSGGVNTVVAQVTSAGSASDLRVDLQDGITFANLDGVELSGYDMDFTLTLIGSGNTYSASGTFKLWDKVGSTLTTPDIYATFTGTNISYSVNGSGQAGLNIDGLLGAVSGYQSILLPSSDPWTFTGDQHDGNFTADADASATTITIPLNVNTFDVGSLVSLYFPILSAGTMQNLFSGATSLGNGDLQAVITPVPAAVLLGVLGLGVAGLKLRKFA